MSDSLFNVIQEIKDLQIQQEEETEVTNTNDEYPQKILRKFHQFYQNKQFVDIDLIVGPHTLKMQAHRIVLSASSQYFSDALIGIPNNSYLELQEVDIHVMHSVLRFMYTGSIKLKSNSVEDVFRAAILFKMFFLIDACSNFMEEILDPGNCLSFASVAWECGNSRILKKSLTFARVHFEEIRNGTKFLKLNPEIIRELLCSDFLCVSSEDVVLQSLIDWADFDADNRHKLLAELLSVIVRYELLDLLYITKTRESVRNIPDCDNIIFDWMSKHIENQNQKIIPKIRARNMNHTYSMLCGVSTEDWNIMTYDGVLDTWSPRVLPKAVRDRTYFKAVLTVDKNQIIIAGGRINGVVTGSVECLDLMNNGIWIPMNTLQEPRNGHVLVLIRENLFIMGGSGAQCNSLLSVERYNRSARNWEKVCLMPSPLEYSHRYAIINDRFYIMNCKRPNKFMCFYSLTFKWTELDFDHDVLKGLDMAAIGNDLYMCLVETKEILIERYSPTENKWYRLNSKGLERFKSLRMFAFCNKLIFWGTDSDGNKNMLVEMYDPEEESFTSLKSLPEILFDLNMK